MKKVTQLQIEIENLNEIMRTWNDIYESEEDKLSDCAKQAQRNIMRINALQIDLSNELDRLLDREDRLNIVSKVLVPLVAAFVPAGATYAAARVQAKSRLEEVRLVNESVERCQYVSHVWEDEGKPPMTDAGRRANQEAISRKRT